MSLCESIANKYKKEEAKAEQIGGMGERKRGAGEK
jgi:hypothetical protein